MAAAVVLAGALSGCSGVQQLPLPGGADLGSHPFTLTAHFADVLDLVPQAAVEVNDVPVGRVTRIDLAGSGTGAEGWSAVVTMRVNGDVVLPADADATLAQSSLLGEKYVELSAPSGGSSGGRLTDHADIPLARTTRDPQVEEVLGALSLLLNGGGIDQIHTITTQLNKAMGGDTDQLRDLLQQINTLATNLDARRADITGALDGINRLSATLATRDQQIGTVLTSLSPGLKVLDQQRNQLISMLSSLDTLSGVAVDTVDRSKDDMVADLKALSPTLQRLADAGDDLPDSLQVLLTYPFTDQVLNGVKGDYLNAYLSMTAAPGTQIIPALDPNAQPPATPQSTRAGKKAATVPLPLPSSVGAALPAPERSALSRYVNGGTK
ncbi:MCE family protein [Streptacidiphilus sp. N1-3]|uniref:MCE family protein n=1 Tax=Streptacidiphilus alkalitolerans TaxID=3342712 RepID=A0ABV6XDU5_9ACTN